MRENVALSHDEAKQLCVALVSAKFRLKPKYVGLADGDVEGVYTANRIVVFDNDLADELVIADSTRPDGTASPNSFGLFMVEFLPR